MNASAPFTRRHFLQTAVVGSAGVLAASLPVGSLAAVVKAPGDPYFGLKMGITSYSLRKFSLDQAIAMTREAGLRYISLKDVHLPLKSSPDELRAAHAKIVAAGLTLLGGGVIYFKNDEKEIRAAFEYCRDAGMPTMICAPDPEALDEVERFAKQFDIRVAIHNHGPDKNQYPSPLDVLRLVRDRDRRMGICMDVGHTVRIGQDPVAVMKECSERLYDYHMKDVTAATPKGESIEVGSGVIDIVAVLRELLRLKYSYHVALEYEAHPDAPMPGIIESLAYIRGALGGLSG